MEELLRLPEEPEPSPALELMRRKEAQRTSYGVFVGNYRELTELLEVVEEPYVAIHLRKEKRNAELDKIYEELTRLLYNFLASAKSLIDHTRDYMDTFYEGSLLLDEYNEKVADHFASSPLQGFVQDLRNYTQHYKLPLISATFTIKRGHELRVTYAISASELRKWDNWTPRSRQYLELYHDKLPLGQLATDYYTIVKEFYEWLRKREPEFNRENPEFLRQRREHIAKLMRTTGPDCDQEVV